MTSKHEFNGKTYKIAKDGDWWKITREDGKSLGVSAAFHGAIHAAVSDAFPRNAVQS